MKKIIPIIVIIMSSTAVLSAQDFRYDAGIAGGISCYMGDANQVSPWHRPGAAISGVFRFLLNYRWAVKTDISAAVQLAAAFAKSGKFVLLAVLNSADVSTLMTVNGVQLKADTEADLGGCSGWTAEAGTSQFHVIDIPVERLSELLEETEEGDVVIVAEPQPLTVSPEGLNVAAVDGVQTVVVGGLRETPREALIDGLQRLDRVKATVVGSVIFA